MDATNERLRRLGPSSTVPSINVGVRWAASPRAGPTAQMRQAQHPDPGLAVQRPAVFGACAKESQRHFAMTGATCLFLHASMPPHHGLP